VSELLAEAGVQLPVLQIGIPDEFIEHGTREDCLAMAGLDTASIRRRIAQWWQGLQPAQPAYLGGRHSA
jgi:1-deoxy-D-xylulose-5-phosphate synthase